MVIVDILRLPLVTLSGNDLDIIIRSNVSLFSNISSLITETSKETLVIPAGNVTVYGPEL